MIRKKSTYLILIFALTSMVLISSSFIGFYLGTLDFGCSFTTILTSFFYLFLILSFLGSRLKMNHFIKFTGEIEFFIAIFIINIILTSTISLAPRCFEEEYYQLIGLVPYSDAKDYYQQLYEWPAKTLNAWNSRRPLNAMINIAEFRIGGFTYLGLLKLRCALLALGIGFFFIALKQHLNVYLTCCVCLCQLFWVWPYAGSMLSEANGIFFSNLAFAAFLNRYHQKWSYWLGLVALILAFSLRPYTPLLVGIFAFILFFETQSLGKFRLVRALVVSMIGSLIIIVVPKIVHSAVGNPNGLPNSNVSLTILGLSLGNNWHAAEEMLTPLSSHLDEKGRVALAYKLAKENVMKNPKPLVNIMVKNTLAGTQGLIKRLGTVVKLNGNWQKIIHFPIIWISLVCFFGFLACIAIFILWKTQRLLINIILASLISYFCGIPFFFSDAGWRGNAILYPGLAMLIILIPLALQKRFDLKSSPIESTVDNQFGINLSTYLSGTLIVAVLLISSSFFPNLFYTKIHHEIHIQLRKGAKSEWLTYNTGIAATENLVIWGRKNDQNSMADFVETNLSKIRSLDYSNGRYYLNLADEKNSKGQQIISPDSLFIAR